MTGVQTCALPICFPVTIFWLSSSEGTPFFFSSSNIIKLSFPNFHDSKNEEWVISNNYQVTILDFQGNPIPNPDFKTEDGEGNPLEISETNLPYLTQGAFDRFSEFRVGEHSLSMRQLLDISVMSDDANGYFDEKENHKTLVEMQTELYNQ